MVEGEFALQTLGAGLGGNMENRAGIWEGL